MSTHLVSMHHYHHHPEAMSRFAPGSQSSSAMTVPSDFAGLWKEALTRYETVAGHKLPAADDFPVLSLKNPDDIIEYVERQGRAFDTCRTKGEKIRRVLKPIADIVSSFLDAGAEAASVQILLRLT